MEEAIQAEDHEDHTGQISGDCRSDFHSIDHVTLAGVGCLAAMQQLFGQAYVNKGEELAEAAMSR